eukprot:TRINITY_DN5365_c0_g4_i1.p1 TRINITY_DN5365_c0_g4~~TRINITY_DN5365_c0_g4_i1.p1  ORF type:complete len:228 (+),score=94.21 TRINITY_DN5365_c0_g4_i1:54-737(+)
MEISRESNIDTLTFKPNKNKNLQFKIVLLGEMNVGKTNILLRYTKNQFSESERSTIGAGFATCRVRIEDFSIKLEIWDTAGQEKYRAVAPMYYRSAHAAILVYDVSKPETLDHCKGWIAELRSRTQSIFIIIAGNKIDLPAEEIKISRETARQFATEFGISLFETSGKTGENVNEMFNSIIDHLYLKTIKERMKENETKDDEDDERYHKIDADLQPLGEETQQRCCS